MASISDYKQDDKGRPTSTARVITDRGTCIYLLPVETFPGHVNNIYLIDHPDCRLLFDVGTKNGHPELLRRLAELERFGLKVKLDDLDWALISHAHIDHFGNAHAAVEAGVKIAIHELDARVLANFSERLLVASRDFGVFLHRAGVRAARVDAHLAMYRASKDAFASLKPDLRLKNGDTIGADWPVLHVPGHCSGMVVVAVDDVVLTADHVLARITPAQSPQAVTPYMGLENYLRSLEKLRDWRQSEMGLGGHEAPIQDLPARIEAIRAHHVERLERIHEILGTPMTISDVCRALFGRLGGYHVILALAEVGAHIECLHELGHLSIENLDEVTADLQAPTLYRALH